MLEWLRFIGQFIQTTIESVVMLIPMLARGVGLISSSFLFAPVFLKTIMALMFAVIIVMWVVNIL